MSNRNFLGPRKHLTCMLVTALYIALGSSAVYAADANRAFGGATYVITVLDSQGNFASRGVIALHAGGTMSVTDSGQGGPAFFFSSQLGSWKVSTPSTVVARTIDFDYPPNADVARLDYTLQFTNKGTQITGTITLTIFPLTADPLGGGGTVVGTFTFTGDVVTP